MKIYKLSQMDCGGFGEASGKLDTQLFPDCPDRTLTKQKHPKKKKKKCDTCKAESSQISKEAMLFMDNFDDEEKNLKIQKLHDTQRQYEERLWMLTNEIKKKDTMLNDMQKEIDNLRNELSKDF